MRTVSSGAESSRAGSSRAGSSRAGSSRAGSSRAGSSRAASIRAGSFGTLPPGAASPRDSSPRLRPLAVLGSLCLLALAAVYLGAVRTAPGQLADETALLGTHIGRRFIGTPVSWLLSLVSEEWLVVGTAVAVAVALLRRRPDLAVTATAVVLLGNVATQLLKAALTYPDLGVEIRRPMENTLPSGHTTVATTIAFAILLVLPPRWWAPGGLLAAGYATATGVGTLVMTWHRPSDAVAAPLLVGATTALVLVLHARYRRGRPRLQEPARLRDVRRARAVAVLLGAAAVLLAAAALALLAVTWPEMGSDPDRFTRFLVYAGGAAGIGAVTCAVVAGLLVGLTAATPGAVDPRRP